MTLIGLGNMETHGKTKEGSVLRLGASRRQDMETVPLTVGEIVEPLQEVMPTIIAKKNTGSKSVKDLPLKVKTVITKDPKMANVIVYGASPQRSRGVSVVTGVINAKAKVYESPAQIEYKKLRASQESDMLEEQRRDRIRSELSMSWEKSQRQRIRSQRERILSFGTVKFYFRLCCLDV